MKLVIRAVVLPVLLAFMIGCGGVPQKPQAVEVDPATRIAKPSQGKALVYFMRTSNYGWLAPAPIYDDDKYIGSIAMEQGTSIFVAKKKTYIAYETNPGKHMFTVYSENVDFLPAELVADKTYYVLVRPVMGVRKIRFYLTPQHDQLLQHDQVPQHELDDVIAQAGQLKATLEGQQWAAANAANYQKTKAEWWEKYQARPAGERPELRPEHGR